MEDVKRKTEGIPEKERKTKGNKRKTQGKRGKLNLEVIVFGVSLYRFTCFRKDRRP